MKKCYPVALFCGLILFSLLGYASESKLIAILKGYRGFQAEFKQTVYDAQHTPVETLSGEIAFEKPDRFRWDIQKPQQQTVLIDNRKMWIYDVDLEQVTIKSISDDEALTPAALLFQSVEQLSSHFNIKTLTTEHETFLLTPKKSDPLYQSIELTFDKNQSLSVLAFSDNLGQKTEIQFSHAQLNQQIASTRFKLVFPKTVDIIKG